MSSDGTVPSAGEAHSPTKPRPKVVLEGVERRYGDVLALAALDLAVHEGEFLTLLRSVRLRQDDDAPDYCRIRRPDRWARADQRP